MTYRLNQEKSAIPYDWTFDLVSPPERLWPLIADTNRMNRLAGMGVTTYSEIKLPGGGRRRIGQGKMLGMAVRWEEHPFKWVHGERYSVMRSFLSGPLEAYRVTVVLEPHGSGTRLTQRVRIVPRSVLLKPFIKIEANKTARRWEQAYRAIDDALTRGGPHPFFHPAAATRPPAVAEAVRRLVDEHQDADLVAQLVDHVLGTSELEVQHMRPFELADRWRAPRLTVLELFLRAARAGLLAARWHHLCPACRGSTASADTLEALGASGRCASCDNAFDAERDVNVEIAFRPAGQVRAVAETWYCVGGPGVTPHIVFQDDVPAGDVMALALPVEAGAYRVRLAQGRHQVGLMYTGPAFPQAVVGEVVATPEGLTGFDTPLAGPVLALRLRNAGTAPVALLVERTAWLDNLVTPALMDTLPAFAALLPGAVAR